MGESIAESELYHACRILFGPGQASRVFLKSLQRSGVKDAYRKRAFETHPDRIGLSGAKDGSAQFVEVHRAYEKLSIFLAAREKGFCFPAEKVESIRPRHPAKQYAWRVHARDRVKKGKGTFSGRHASDSTFRSSERLKKSGHAAMQWNIDSLYCGVIPSRPMMLGHFLYYSGWASWRTIVQALIWQRLQRPRFGEIGRRFGWLSEEDVLVLSGSRSTGMPFGQVALQNGLLTKKQLDLILFRQKNLQKKFGEYFLEKQLLTPGTLDRLISRYEAHNAGFSSTCHS